ncbi:MAG: M56 family metallopeptidase [Candidatus Aquilonibacter sp.]
MNAALLNSLWQGAFIAAVAALVTFLPPARNASTRYAVWFTALIALAILPLLSLWHPTDTFTALPTPVLHTASAASRVAAQAATASGSWLVLTWIAGVALCLFRIGLSYARIDRIVRNASPAPELGPRVMTSDDVTTPIAARLFSPVVIIPSSVAATFERRDLESIVYHELAHIRRGDVTGNFIQRLIEACLFFNPWVYVIGRQMIKERESACDDWVVHAMRDPDRYANCLAQLAQMRRSRLPLLTPSAIGSKHVLVGRIARLLNGKVIQLKINYLVLGASVMSFGILAVLLQSSEGLASTGSARTGSTDGLIAASACTFPHGYADAKPRNATPPEIPKSDYKSGLSAGALVNIAADGHPVSAKIVKSSGNAAVDRATVEAAMHSTYYPATKACKAVSSQYYFHIETGP